MKKNVSRILSLVVLVALLTGTFFAMTVTVSAASMKVVFTSSSSFKVGGKATVDSVATSASVMDDSSVMADMYNAALEQNMTYTWVCSNGSNKTGKSVTWTDADAGKEYVCRVGFYAEPSCSTFIDYVDSQPFTISGGSKIPTITTKSLPDAKLGVYYGATLECSDPDVKWDLFRSSLPKGMDLTSDGHLEGTPEEAGDFYVVVMATPASGDEYATTAEFELTVKDEGYAMELVSAPDKVVYTAGEKLDMKGLEVKIYHHYLGDIMVSKNGEGLTYSKKELVTVGEQKIKLTYKDAVDFFIVTVEAAAAEPPEITTKSLPEATVGEAYKTTIKSTDSKAEFNINYNPGKANDFEKTGLKLSKAGVISGTPTKAGSYTFTVCAAGDGGEGYKTFTLTVKEAAPEETTAPSTEPTTAPSTEPTTLPVESVPAETEPQEPEVGTAQPIEPTTGTTGAGMVSGALMGIIIGIAVAALVVVAVIVGVIILIVVLIKRKKKA